MDKNDLISRSELRKCAIPCLIHNGALTDMCVPLYQIDNAPTVKTYCYFCGQTEHGQIEERPQGEWRFRTDTEWHYECNQCKGLSPWKSPFCGICGADMRQNNKQITIEEYMQSLKGEN
jgi:hypothetical protein